MAERTPFQSPRWKGLRRFVLARDGSCQIRGPRCTGGAEDADHIVSWRLGEQYWLGPDNLRAACRKCNRGRRVELAVMDADVVPAGTHVPSEAVVLADLASGKVWIFDPVSKTLIKPGETLNHDQTRKNDDW